MPEYIAFTGVVLTGIFGILGYFIQRGIDRRNALLAKKREVYADFLMVYSKVCAGDQEAGHTIFHALGQIGLYGSPPVVKAANNLAQCVAEAEGSAAVRSLLLAMRSEVAAGNPVSEDDIKYLVVGGRKER